uniref:ribonuclease H n=1 Tax=Seriola lalandi dorsalis TaxID=1841481 RepID=A0A3B4WXW0_SERLL
MPANSTHYTVLDLCSAFFSVPLHTDSQFLFAFTYDGQQYTFTRLPQGYTESPTIFSRTLHNDLKDISFPGGSTLIQYVDDLLLASPSSTACETDTIVLLNALAEKGHKTSLQKAQLCQKVVQYLGHTLSGSTRVLTPSRIKAITEVPKPVNISQMKTFLGMTGYCRQWIIDYASQHSSSKEYGHFVNLIQYCSIPLPKGVYWICGMKAYEYLPKDWSGVCGLGHVIPAMRVLTAPPEVHIVKRDLYTHKQTTWTRLFGALIPSYGVMASLDQIRDLSHAVEDLANSTAKGISLLTKEMTAIRMMTLQNRAALDYLLASQGGTCAIIGTECCTFIPNNNATIQEITNHMHDIAKLLHEPASTSLFDWFKLKLGTLGYLILEFVLLSFGILFFISLLINFLKSIFKSLVSKPTPKIMYSTTTHPAPPNEEDSSDFLFKIEIDY